MSATISAATPKFELLTDNWGRLVLIDAAGGRHDGVTPIRSFPLTDPEHWISICDTKHSELVCIEEPLQLPSTTRDILFAALLRTEFMPVIERH